MGTQPRPSPIKICQAGFTLSGPCLKRAGPHAGRGVKMGSLCPLSAARCGLQGQRECTGWSWVCALERQRPWARWLNLSEPPFPICRIEIITPRFTSARVCVGLCNCNHACSYMYPPRQDTELFYQHKLSLRPPYSHTHPLPTSPLNLGHHDSVLHIYNIGLSINGIMLTCNPWDWLFSLSIILWRFIT